MHRLAAIHNVTNRQRDRQTDRRQTQHCTNKPKNDL